MARLSFEEIEKELDFDFFLSRESIPFKMSRGVSGMQFHIKTCPNPTCGDSRYRTYMGEESGRGNCFVCSKNFNKTTFIHDYLGAGKWTETFAFIEQLLKDQGWRPKRQAMVQVEVGDIVLPSSTPLPDETGANLAYLDQRGFDGDICKYFGLRFCEFGWWKFKDEKGLTATQDFSSRVIIPVFDLDGMLKTFQGRDLTGHSTRKYLFPMSLPGTGRYLLNGQNVVATDSVVMGEGIFDIAAIKMAFDAEIDLRGVVPVGSFGKHLSYGSVDGNDQLGRFNQLRMKGLKFVTIMWDGEKNALIAALNAAKLLRGIGLIVKIAVLPAGKDPNEVIGPVVVAAYRKAELYTPALDIRWRLRNPYK